MGEGMTVLILVGIYIIIMLPWLAIGLIIVEIEKVRKLYSGVVPGSRKRERYLDRLSRVLEARNLMAMRK